MDHAAAAVAKDLDLDMARIGDEFLDQNAVIAKALVALALAAIERGEEVLGGLDLAHALAAAAGDRLDQDRIADPPGLGGEMRRLLVFTVIARRDRHTGLFHQRLGLVLETHGPDRLGGRTNEDDVVLGTGFREARILGQEAVAGVDGISAGDDGGLDDLVGQEIALRGRGRAEQDRLIGLADMGRFGVRLGIDGNGTDPHPLGGPHHAAGNLAAIGDQKGLDHEPVIPVVWYRPVMGLCVGIAQRPRGRN